MKIEDTSKYMLLMLAPAGGARPELSKGLAIRIRNISLLQMSFACIFTKYNNPFSVEKWMFEVNDVLMK